MEQYNTENIHSTLICELRNKYDFEDYKVNTLNVEEEYEIITIPNESIIKKIVKSIPIAPPRPPILKILEPIIRLRIRKPKSTIPIPPPRPLMDFEKKNIPIPPPRPLMDFEKKNIPIPPPRPLMDFEKKNIPIPPPRPLMDFEKKSIPVPPPRPLMDFEKKSIPVPPPRPLMDFEKKSIPVPPPRPLMDFEKKSIPVPPPRPLMDFEKKSIPVPPPRPLMDFEKKSIPVPPPRPLMDFEKKTTKKINFKIEDDDDFTFVPMMVEKTNEYPDEIINAHEKVMNELMSKNKKMEKSKKTNSMLCAPTKMNNHCLLMYEIKNFNNKLNKVPSSIKDNKKTPSTLKDMLLYEIKNHKIILKKTQEPAVRSNLNSRGYMAWELQNSNILKNIKETKKECKKIEKEMPKSLSPIQQIIWEIKNRDITLRKTVPITKKEAPLKLSFPEQLVLEIKNHRPLRKVALEDIPKAIGGTRVSNEKDISLELLNKTANDVCNQSREKVYIVQQVHQRLTNDDQYAKLLCSIKKFKKCGEENDEEINSSAYSKKYTNPMKNKYYGSANSNKNIWWDEEHKKIMRSIRRRNFSLRSIEDEVWVYVPPNHPAEKQKKSRFWLW
ncbi:hypothetical protein BCR36DRAFT_584527 [Piromyces finnis]|uniref:Uncharacterized protein n=1 Tax=Piromyces finnis TaxID=1754191 RepID=A0A1Y1V6I8_9FUNG|nr:hypothetical protein BCR36DRAFT_584527 [Piromyces finnis]|eukprot:ORX47815.1 hypothetical protein BCR36DRAFT_584527 [Piromyces finnis]